MLVRTVPCFVVSCSRCYLTSTPMPMEQSHCHCPLDFTLRVSQAIVTYYSPVILLAYSSTLHIKI